jgi:hypothetical protein
MDHPMAIRHDHRCSWDSSVHRSSGTRNDPRSSGGGSFQSLLSVHAGAFTAVMDSSPRQTTSVNDHPRSAATAFARKNNSSGISICTATMMLRCHVCDGMSNRGSNVFVFFSEFMALRPTQGWLSQMVRPDPVGSCRKCLPTTVRDDGPARPSEQPAFFGRVVRGPDLVSVSQE